MPRSVLAVAAFVFLQTLWLLCRQDSFAVLFWLPSDIWAFVLLLWLKNLLLSAAAAFLAAQLLRATLRAAAENDDRQLPLPLFLLGLTAAFAAGAAVRWWMLRTFPP